MYDVIPTKRYRKDYKRLLKSGYSIPKLEHTIDQLAAGNTLPADYRDHALHGKLEDSRACHIGPDWLLLYKRDKKELILLLLGTGTHRDVLGIE